MTNLTGKTALVTGGSRGIGRASALALAKAGAQVLVHYGSNEKAADAVVAEIRAAGGHAEKVAADLLAPDGPHRLTQPERARTPSSPRSVRPVATPRKSRRTFSRRTDHIGWRNACAPSSATVWTFWLQTQ